jgi:hypothetical protein
VTRRRAIIALGSLGGGAACAAVALVLAGCPNTVSTSIYTPPTGIQIDSQTLVAGVGCGSGPGQVYRYAAVVGPPAKDGGFGTGGMTPITSGVFDCFSDALFTNLPSPDGGPTDFGLDIYAYDRASFPAELGGCENLPLSMSCPGDHPSVVLRYAVQATWTTHCRATQSQGVPQVAQCPQPLEPTPADAGVESDAGGDATTGGDAGDASAEAADAPGEVADAPTAESSDGPGVSGEGGDAPLE